MVKAGHSNPRWETILEYSILTAALIISALIILKGSGIVPKPSMDQHFVETVNIQLRREGGHFLFQYPNLMHAGGITSSLLAGMYKIIIPTTPTTLNWHFKIFAMAGHLISSFFLLRTAIPNLLGLRILGFLIVATSGYQLIEPSSEVVSAGLLNLFFIGVLRRWPRVTPAFFLASFGLAKVELTLSALALSLLWWGWEWQQGRKNSYLNAILTWLFIGLLLAPSFIVTGSNLLKSDRSSTAFFSTYKDTFRMHQFQLVPPTEDEAAVAIKQTIFRDSPTFKDVLIKHPLLYFDFLGISASRSIPNVVKVFKVMLIPLMIALASIKKIQANKFLLLGSLLVAVCIILPSWLVIFLRIRYIAKVLPALTTATIASSVELLPWRKNNLTLVWICGIATIMWQLLSLTPYQD